MATGANIQPGRGIAVTNLPPTVDLRTGEAEAWDSVRRVADRFVDAGKADLIKRAQVRGAEEGAAVAAGGEMPKRGWLFGGDVAAARTAALESAYTARVRTDIDARDAELRRDHRNDPEAYERAAGEMVSGFIQGAAPEFAVDVETYARAVTQRGQESVALARASRDEQETVQGIAVRRGVLQERMIALAAQGEVEGNVDFLAASTEYNELQDAAESNPSVLYSPEQRAKDDEGLTTAVAGAVIGAESIREYAAAGGGTAGTARALRFLNDNILDGDDFAALTPEARARLYRESVANLTAKSQSDREDRRLEAEQERVQNEIRRDAVGSYRFRIETGDTITESELRADATLQDRDRAQLLAAARGAARREQDQVRRDAALEARNNRDAYNDWRDQAAAGSLTPSELADAVNGGQLSRGQARTLQGLNDRSLGPVVEDVMAPLEDALRGGSRRDVAQVRARAEQNAVAWARNNPDAPMDLRLSVGRDIAARHLGTRSAGQPATAQTRLNGTAARVAAAAARIDAARRSGHPFSLAEENRIRNEARAE